MRNLLRLLREPRGTALVLVAAVIGVLLGLAVLTVDVGILYLNKAEVQTAADAAALAGAHDLHHSTDLAKVTAERYAAANGKAGDEVITNTDVANQITVTVRRDVDLYFAKLFDVAQSEVHATATAGVQPATGVAGIVPFGVVLNTSFTYGTQVTLKYGSGGSQSGNFQALALGGTGASNYLANIKNGYSGVVHIGDWIQTETGNMVGPTNSGVSYRVNEDPGVTYLNVQEGSGRIVIVPMLTSFVVSGRTDVQVAGFAAFFLEGTGKHGTDNYVIGRFLQVVVPGEGGGSGGTDWGVYTTKLIR